MLLDWDPAPEGDVEIVQTVGNPVAFVHTQPDLLGASRHRIHRDTCTGRHQAPYAPGSETSQAAADALEHSATEHQRTRILTYLEEHGPAHDQRIADALNLSGDTVRPRRLELLARGDIYEHPTTGRTHSGRAAKRWAVTPPQ